MRREPRWTSVRDAREQVVEFNAVRAAGCRSPVRRRPGLGGLRVVSMPPLRRAGCQQADSKCVSGLTALYVPQGQAESTRPGNTTRPGTHAGAGNVHNNHFPRCPGQAARHAGRSRACPPGSAGQVSGSCISAVRKAPSCPAADPAAAPGSPVVTQPITDSAGREVGLGRNHA